MDGIVVVYDGIGRHSRRGCTFYKQLLLLIALNVGDTFLLRLGLFFLVCLDLGYCIVFRSSVCLQVSSAEWGWRTEMLCPDDTGIQNE